jgi:hypothetical protein
MVFTTSAVTPPVEITPANTIEIAAKHAGHMIHLG